MRALFHLCIPHPWRNFFVLAQEDLVRISSDKIEGGPECSLGEYEYPAYWLRLAGGLVDIPRGKRRSCGMKRYKKPKKTKEQQASYDAYMHSDEWERFKDRRRNSPFCRGHFCHAKGCNSIHKLQFHHRTYQNFGKENFQDVVLICRECHKRIHKLNESGFTLRESTDAIMGVIGSRNWK